METTVIIPCWIVDSTLLQLTHRCVQSIRDTSDAKIILIDNGSRLWSDFLTDEADILIKNSENLGYVKAINQGFKQAKTDYIVAGNNDYVMVDGWEQEMQNVLGIDTAGVSCLITDEDKIDGEFRIEHGTPGGWWMIKRETLDKVGLLDERFFNTYSDIDLCWRLKKIGKSILTSPKVVVHHHGEASLSRDINRKNEHDDANFLFNVKWENDDRFNEFCALLKQ